MSVVQWCRRLAMLAAVAVVLSGSAVLAEDEEKDDLTARKRQSTDVIRLLKGADVKLQRCLNLFVEGDSYAEIEREGRDAKNLYRGILELEPSNSYASLSIGYVDLILGRAAGANLKRKENHFSTAMSRFREALEKRPGYADAHLYMAQVQALRGSFAKAEKNLRLILNSGIEDSQVHSWLAYVLHETKKADEAGRHLARAIELDDPAASARWSRDNQGTVGK